METLKFYAQTTVETITTVIIMFLVIFSVNFLSVDAKTRDYKGMDIKKNPGTEVFNRFRHPFAAGTLKLTQEEKDALKRP